MATSIWPDSGFGFATSAPESFTGREEDRASWDAQQVKKKEEEEKRIAPFRKWADEERARYFELRQKAEKDAQAKAEKMIPTSMDISLLGGGWSFLLEFSTVIVIIFVLLCLGLLGVITGKDVTTILASIAGYVLGKASSLVQRGQDRDAAGQRGTTP
jgi:hypothetical protein